MDLNLIHLPSNTTLDIIKLVYPTQLLNVFLVNRHFGAFSSEEKLYRALIEVQFQPFAPDWVFKCPPDWTWKMLFIRLFNMKRQMISEMYARMGLTYEFSYRPFWGNGLNYFIYSGISASTYSNGIFPHISFEDKLNMSIYPLDMLGVTKINLEKYEPLSFDPKSHYALTIEDIVYRRRLLKMYPAADNHAIMNSKTGTIWKDEMLLDEGFCVWHFQLDTFISLFPMTGLEMLSNIYSDIIMTEYNRKLEAAASFLNEEVNVTYGCSDLTLQNFSSFQEQITLKLREHEWDIILYAYGHQGLSLIISRYPKSILFDEDTDYDSKASAICQPQLFNHLNEDIEVRRLLEYSTQDKPEIPKIIELSRGNPTSSATIFNTNNSQIIVLKLIETQIFAPRICHLKDNDREFESPFLDGRNIPNYSSDEDNNDHNYIDHDNNRDTDQEDYDLLEQELTSPHLNKP